MRHRLIICTFEGQRAEVNLAGKADLVLGRDPDCDIYINDPMVSAKHAIFRPIKDGFEFIDTDSTNGSCVNGKTTERIRLLPGDELVLGKSVYVLHLAASESVPDAVLEATSQILFHQPPGNRSPQALASRIELLQGELGRVEERLRKRAQTLVESTVREQDARGQHDRLIRANSILDNQYETRSADLVIASKKLEQLRRSATEHQRMEQDKLRGLQARATSAQMGVHEAQEKLQRLEASIHRQQAAKGRLERESQTLKMTELKRRDELLRLERELALNRNGVGAT